MRYLFLIFILTGCFSDKPMNYSREEFLEMAKKGEPNLRIVTPKGLTDVIVNCRDYTPRCRYGYRVIVRNIQMVILFYEQQEDALKAAKRIRGYVSRNWVMDEVRGEPVLERYVTKYLKAKKAF